MKLIKYDVLNKKIEEDFCYDFNLENDGVYLIEIIAGAKSWKQNLIKFISFFRDDNLAVKINEIEFPKLNGKRGLFDGEIAWNGNNLKSLSKTCIFAISLSQGNHVLHFLVKQNPILKSVKISKIENENQITYIPTDNNPAEDGNRRQWMSFVLMNLKAKNLSIQARANSYEKEDDDDIKLIINGDIQKNNTDKAHKYWYWCGRVSKGGKLIFVNDLDPNKERHYIELWADRRPFLYKVEVGLKEEKQDQEEKRTPTVEDPKWTGDWNDESEHIILARVVFGEARNTLLSDEARIAVAWSIRNRVDQQGKTYHEVILSPKQYSALGEGDPNRIFVEDPLHTKKQIDKEAWENCYKIAGQVIAGEISDPVDGANHYYDESIDQPQWLNKDNFVRKIDTFFFHRL